MALLDRRNVHHEPAQRWLGDCSGPLGRVPTQLSGTAARGFRAVAGGRPAHRLPPAGPCRASRRSADRSLWARPLPPVWLAQSPQRSNTAWITAGAMRKSLAFRAANTSRAEAIRPRWRASVISGLASLITVAATAPGCPDPRWFQQPSAESLVCRGSRGDG